MSHSTHVGFSGPGVSRATEVARSSPPEPCLEIRAKSGPEGVPFGVGHQKDPLPQMRGTDGGSRYNLPLRVIPEEGKVSEYLAHSPSKESWDVLHENDSGSKLAKDSCEVWP